jgi:hypothetical protein
MRRKGTYFPGLGIWPAKDLKIWREEWQRAALDGTMTAAAKRDDPMAVAEEVAYRVLMRMSGVPYGR